MMMKCRYCKKKMDLAEFLTYAEAYLIKNVLVAVAIPLFIAMIKHWLSTPTKGFIDSTMAGLANNFAMECPQCKRADKPWDPAPVKKPKTLKQENENVIS